MSKKPTLYLIDGSSYIFRAFFGIRQNLSTSKGMPTNALYGFTTMLQKVIRDESPDYVMVAFDSKEKTFRHEWYPDYKANRDTPPEELQQQFPYFEPLVEAHNIVGVRQPGFEADDIIGTLAKQGEAKGMEVTIVSGDKDMMQLIGPNITMLDTMKDKRFGREEVIEKFGVPPEQVIEVMGLMGDSSDHIPGVKGVGPKTATDLIQKFGSIASLYDRLDEVEKDKLRAKLEGDRENALLSHKLVIINTEMDLSCNIDDMKILEPDQDKLTELFTEWEFTSLLAGMKKPAKREKKVYQTILQEEDLDRLLTGLKNAGEFALDLETTSLHPVEAEMVGISFAYEGFDGCYIPLMHRYLGVPQQLDKSLVIKKLKPILEDPAIKKCGHNIKYDLIVLRNEGIELKGISFDSIIASYVLDPSRRSHSMDDLAMEFFGHQTIKYKDVAGTGMKQIGFDEVDIERASEYAAEDSDLTWRLLLELRPKLTEDTLSLFTDMEMPLLHVLAEMEMNGVYLERKELKELSTLIQGKLEIIEQEIYQIAGENFNINSPKQLAVILFEKLNLPVIKKTKTGYSTDVSVLEELSSEHQLPEQILTFRQLSKLKSTYVDALQEEIYSKTGRVHTSFNQTVAATGRLSSSNPNLQNIPIRSEMGREIRKSFLAEGEGMLLSADYSQVELRILAHLSADKALINAFNKGEDIHTRTAAEIFGSSLEDVDLEGRRMAKAVNFGIVYGLSAFGLSRQLKITQREAKNFIEQYFALYKNVKVYMEETVEQARSLGYTSTIMNRRRYLPDLHSKNRQVREAAQRIAINSPIQGSAADMIKVAMIQLSNELRKQKLRSKMILQVHDELVFECPQDEKSVMEKLVKDKMEGVCEFTVPIIVDIGWGKNWDEAH